MDSMRYSVHLNGLFNCNTPCLRPNADPKFRPPQMDRCMCHRVLFINLYTPFNVPFIYQILTITSKNSCEFPKFGR